MVRFFLRSGREIRLELVQCTAVEMRSSIRLWDLMIARGGFVHSNGVGFLFHARRRFSIL